MDIQKEREAFDAQFATPENGHFLDAVGESDPIQESIAFKANWIGRLKCAESKQSEIDDLKAQLKAVHESRANFVEYCRMIEVAKDLEKALKNG